nr:MAG TPA: hypothetical protein [Caudoviricetes sp.]
MLTTQNYSATIQLRGIIKHFLVHMVVLTNTKLLTN